MSTLIRIQFGPRYLDFEIPQSCRGKWRQFSVTGCDWIKQSHWLLDTKENNCSEELISCTCVKTCTVYDTYSRTAPSSHAGREQATANKKRQLKCCFSPKKIIIIVWALVMIRVISHLTPYHLTPLALSCTLIFMETEQQLPSTETGAWLDCLSVLNEMCLQNKPTGASIPRTSLVRHKKKSGHITITCVLFFHCSTAWCETSEPTAAAQRATPKTDRKSDAACFHLAHITLI